VVTGWEDDRPTVTDAFCAGGEWALAELYLRWSPLVYSIALGSLEDVADAEKVTQRVFTGAWAARMTFDSTRSSLPAWLIGITRDEVVAARTGWSTPAQPWTQQIRVTPVDDTTNLADVTVRLLLVDAVSQVDAEPQQVLRMALYDGLDHAQIAERTGLPTATVKSHIGRGLLDVRKRLEVQSDAR